jgi:hypothetical protein
MIFAIVQRGQNRGIRVTPHKYANGKYHVAKKKEDLAIEVDYHEIESYLKRGYKPALLRPVSFSVPSP